MIRKALNETIGLLTFFPHIRLRVFAGVFLRIVASCRLHLFFITVVRKEKVT